MSRLSRISSILACLLTAATSTAGAADDYPSRPIRWLVGFAAGGPNDVVARIMAQWLSERLGQQVIVENRPGAASNLAVQTTISAPPDGYNLVFLSSSNSINATLYQKLSFNWLTDLAPIAALLEAPNVMEVNPSVPVKSVAEFIAYAKANPGKINMASGGIGTSVHMSGELFQVMTGTKLVHVPYRGAGPAVTDMLSGQMQVMFDNLPNSVGHIKAGSLRALGVTTAKRSHALPEVPSIGETVAGFEASVWYGVGAPPGTPAAIVERLNREINAGLTNDKLKARLSDLGATPTPMSPAAFAALMAADTEKWAKVVKFSGAKVE